MSIDDKDLMASNYLYGNRIVKSRSAAGARGVLVRSVDGEIRFRMYCEDGSITDYEIRHGDLGVTISEKETAVFYRGDGCRVLDHDPGMLGLERVGDW